MDSLEDLPSGSTTAFLEVVPAEGILSRLGSISSPWFMEVTLERVITGSSSSEVYGVDESPVSRALLLCSLE